MKKILLLFMVAVMILSLCSCESKEEKQAKYDTATRYMRQCKYDEAIALFNEIDGFEDSSEAAVYCEALSYCEFGDYESTYETLTKIPEYSQTPKLLCQIYYETRLFEGLNDLVSGYKNPDSLKVNEIYGYYYKIPKSSSEASISKPIFVLAVSGQNAYGGYAINYVVLGEDSDTALFEQMGYCTSLDIDDIDDSDELLVAYMIKLMADNVNDGSMEKLGEDYINLERVKSIISSGKYGRIKRINGLTYDMFGSDINS